MPGDAIVPSVQNLLADDDLPDDVMLYEISCPNVAIDIDADTADLVFSDGDPSKIDFEQNPRPEFRCVAALLCAPSLLACPHPTARAAARCKRKTARTQAPA